MTAVIVIEIIIGVVILAAAIRFAVRDTMQREANREREVEPTSTTQAPARTREPKADIEAQPQIAQPQVAQPLSEVGAPEQR